MNLSQPLKQAAKAVRDLGADLLGEHRRQLSTPSLWVLMYHRVLPSSDRRYLLEEPGMVVTPQTFERHLSILTRYFTILPLSEWVERRLNHKPLPARACAITFDDGWLDNYEFAFPILEKFGLPATLFAVSGMIGTNEQFWPNRVISLIRGTGPEQLAELSWLRAYLPATIPPQFSREDLSTLIGKLKALPDNVIHDHLNDSGDWQQADASPALVNWEQLGKMADSGLVEVGSHTCNHYRLNENLDPRIAESQIVSSQVQLSEALGRPVELFCYPNGDCSALAVDTVSKHYKAAVTTARGINNGSHSLHTLNRIGVHEDISNTGLKFRARLSNRHW